MAELGKSGAICGVVHATVEESGKKSGESGSEEAAEGITLTPKAPSATKPSKKRKASSPTTTETPLPKERATRSKAKQSESDLQKALAKSKKKRMDKGKGKVTESSKAVDVEEMEHVYQEDYTTMEAAEPSLAKKTRSALKSKQVRVFEDEEWSGEEKSESDGEQDKLTMFGKRKILKGRLLKDLMEPGMVRLVDTLAAQGWKDVVFQMDGRLARN
ncbi:uncharacterized protein [Nicotiana sylvestris]|uniref:uncharacterized protein n=1 Tax=Nicotiana sylvestris TaxID=4096 RepID=UPI00388C4BF2